MVCVAMSAELPDCKALRILQPRTKVAVISFEIGSQDQISWPSNALGVETTAAATGEALCTVHVHVPEVMEVGGSPIWRLTEISVKRKIGRS
jgi:hypothetical protein